jgi:hypothetical protein
MKLRRIVPLPLVLGLAAALLAIAPGPAGSFPAAPDEARYQLYGRVFPDPHGCLKGLPLASPWAKGSICAVQFIQWDDALAGIAFLEERFPRYVSLVNLRDIYGDDFRSAGIRSEDMSRDHKDLYAIKVTDAKSSIPEAKRKHFVYSLSIHGIERAGLEGGIRAAEDLVTWAACEESSEAAPACASEGPFPKRILEPTDSGPTAGEVVRNGVVYFIFANPDGWARGNLTSGGVAYQRYNGNGMDLNRDWPSVGYTEPLYTPWSEPESRGFGRYLLDVKNKTAAGKFDGSIDLHGMLTARSFSFTLLGAGQRDYRKNAITVDTAITTFRDSEERLSWSPLIAPADSCPGQLQEPAFGGNIPMCSDQWGTVWDTIDYQVTGAFGDWADSSMGLDAVGIDNEMALSHLSNCGVGNCFEPGVEQLHIDGNKGLIYSQISALLFEKPVIYKPAGALAYVLDPARTRDGGGQSAGSGLKQLPVQETIEALHALSTEAFSFEVKGTDQGVHNGGLAIELSFANVRGITPITNAFDYVLEYCGAPEHPGDVAGECHEVARYFNQAGTYLQAGARIDLNDPKPGPYRLSVAPDELGNLAPMNIFVSFSEGASFPVPKQRAYDVSRMDFFTHLNKYAAPDDALESLTVEKILADPALLNHYDSLVIADRFMPGYAATGKSKYTKAQFEAYAAAFKVFVERGGNLVLTDGALVALPALSGKIKPEAVTRGYWYAGWMDFDDGSGETYATHALAKGVNKEGTAEGSATISGQTFSHRHQTYEPVPIGYYVDASGDCSNALCDSPNWFVDEAAWKAAGGTVGARTLGLIAMDPAAERRTGVSLGELALGKGKIRIAGAMLPEPTEANYHPFGLSSYSVTYTGYQLFENLTAYTNPARVKVGGTKIVKPSTGGSQLPATGVGGAWVGLGLTIIGLAGGLRLRRRSA